MPRTKSKKGKADSGDKPDVVSSSFHDDNVWEDDVEPPPGDGEEDCEEPSVEIYEVEKEPSEADDEEGSAKGNSGGLSGVAALEFSPDELPMLGYTIASFVFFLAAVTNRQKTHRSMDLDLYRLDDDDTIYLGVTPTQAYNKMFVAMGGLPSGYFAYALCLGIFGVLMGAGVIFWSRISANKSGDRAVEENSDASEDGKDEEDEEEPTRSQSEDVLNKYRWLVNGFLLLWASIGWAVFTLGRSEVFAYTGNGFFALWAMLLCAVWNFGITPDDLVKQYENTDSVVYGLVATSVVTIVELTAGVSWGIRSNKGIAAYALAVSVISIVFGLVTAGFSVMAARNGTDKLNAKIGFWIVLVVFVMSIISAFLTTFIGPFLTTGNGYFAVWGSVLFSGLACSKLRKEMQLDMA